MSEPSFDVRENPCHKSFDKAAPTAHITAPAVIMSA